MRKSWLLLMCAAGVLMLAPGAMAITVIVDGKQLPASPPAMEVDGRVLLPMRAVFEALHADVTWNAPTRTAIAMLRGKTVSLTVDSRTALVDGAPVMLDVPARMAGGRVYVPVRFPAEAFGAEVRWMPQTRTVLVSLGAGHTAVDAPDPTAGGRVAPTVLEPRDGAVMPTTRVPVRIQTTPGVLQVIYTMVYRGDTGEFVRMVPGIRHMPDANGMYEGAIAAPRVSIGTAVPLRYEVHFRNGPNEGDPVTIVTLRSP